MNAFDDVLTEREALEVRADVTLFALRLSSEMTSPDSKLARRIWKEDLERDRLEFPLDRQSLEEREAALKWAMYVFNSIALPTATTACALWAEDLEFIGQQLQCEVA